MSEDKFVMDLLKRISEIERVLAILMTVDRQPNSVQSHSDNNVSYPPTDAQLDAAFGTPAAVGDGFVGVLDDNGAGTDVYLCVSDGTLWWYETLAQAL